MTATIQTYRGARYRRGTRTVSAHNEYSMSVCDARLRSQSLQSQEKMEELHPAMSAHEAIKKMAA